ncbi:acyl carrier protein [Aliiglaciecola sp. 3_MG-2023]|uniref:acyl carrier protein n=1 Tax=Aliiglaciecola sp. 3_MG-2023 TaxID=3062644 RepID=UPI0026E34273|nr:acyl carrier protein [Aliiglaciecola sp. 3_MG-2023]MDO6691744.1 acyl carrier protein [Aliiglaciecola sp. 3_MG-2023]
MNNQERIKQAFSDSLAIPLEKVSDDLAYNSIPEWDSTAHMILIAELENLFNVMLDTDDIIDMSSVAKAKEILAKYEIEFDA